MLILADHAGLGDFCVWRRAGGTPDGFGSQVILNMRLPEGTEAGITGEGVGVVAVSGLWGVSRGRLHARGVL